MDALEKWEFDGPWQAAFVDGLSGKWLRLSLNGRSVASYEVAAWGSEQACIEAAWRYAYEPQDEPAPDLMAELVEAVDAYKTASAHEMTLPTDRGGMNGPKGKAIAETLRCKGVMFAALAKIKEATP